MTQDVRWEERREEEEEEESKRPTGRRSVQNQREERLSAGSWLRRDQGELDNYFISIRLPEAVPAQHAYGRGGGEGPRVHRQSRLPALLPPAT